MKRAPPAPSLAFLVRPIPQHPKAARQLKKRAPPSALFSISPGTIFKSPPAEVLNRFRQQGILQEPTDPVRSNNSDCCKSATGVAALCQTGFATTGRGEGCR